MQIYINLILVIVICEYHILLYYYCIVRLRLVVITYDVERQISTF